jgi:hypothetical protein
VTKATETETGHQMDNSTGIATGVATGRAAGTSRAIGIGAATVSAVGKATGRSNAEAKPVIPSTPRTVLHRQVREMRARMPAAFERMHSEILDRLDRHLSNRGVEASAKRADAFALFDAEVEAGRDPEDPKFTAVAARRLATDPRQIRRWRDAWKEERGRN